MNGPLYKFFVEDHRRLEELLDAATAKAPQYDMDLYGKFRAGLLKHIKMEENVIIPAAQKARGGEPLPIAPKIRLDHGALVALLVSAPSRTIINALKGILTCHNPLEENPGGLYNLCEQHAGKDIDEWMKKLEDVPEVPVLPLRSGPNILEATRRALERAGYSLDDYSQE
jgi:hypothetical protein